MSRIGDLGKDLKNLPQVLASYLDDIECARKILPIEGKMLDVAFKEQCAWPAYYNEKKAELKTLVKHIERHVDSVRGTKTKHYTENYSRALGERVMDKYINADEDYIKAHQLLLEVEEIYDIYNGILDGFEKRGFALRDFTAARINEFHKYEI